MNSRFAVIDVETTGFGKKDSVLEIGVVLLDGDEIVLEWDTLINPNRDIANSDIHGLSPRHLSTAPFFADVANDIASLVSDRILVAHNLPFDQRMLFNEFEKLEIISDAGKGICTYNATRMKLSVACEKFGIRQSETHRALSDARATAVLLSRAGIDVEGTAPAQIQHEKGRPFSRTISRNAFESGQSQRSSRIRKIMHSLEVPYGNSAEMSYMDALTSALSDLYLDSVEENSLREWAEYLGLDSNQVNKTHERYLVSFIDAAMRDGLVTEEEQNQINALSKILGVNITVKKSVESRSNLRVKDGIRVCFTGSAKGVNGEEITREELEEIARNRGMIPVDSVTKKSCDLVVAADINSMSSKARKAKEWGISLMSVKEFLSPE